MSDKIPRAIQELCRPSEYESRDLKLSDTMFHIYTRKQNRSLGLIGIEGLSRALRKIWPLFLELPRNLVREAYIVDVDAPLGGGPLGDPFCVGIFSSAEINSEMQAYIELTTGWKKQSSTQSYIDREYRKFPERTDAYVEDMVTHELGHLFFGYGLTIEKNKDFHQNWFSLGMGMLYDRIVWERMYPGSELASPLFTGVILQYTEKYASIREIDQRLIKPDTWRDSDFGLARAQVYAHGKAYLFLKSLREILTPSYFDGVVHQFLLQGGIESSVRQTTGHPIERSHYEVFRALLAQSDALSLQISEVEVRFQI